ncbi:MAG: VPLPA-CTERM sorting domain-containing protein [Acidobacteriota bacterium]
MGPALAALAVAGIAGATTVTCPAPPNGGVPASISGLTIDCGGLTFSNFSVLAAAGFSGAITPAVSLVTAQVVDGTVFLGWNPNLSGAAGAQDIHFYYEVSGPTTSVDLTVGGVNATIGEKVCSSPISQSGPNQNACAPGTEQANIQAFSAPAAPQTATAAVSGSSFFVFKDIGVAQGGALSSFAQGWTTAGAEVPEPAAMLLIGTGFIGLGMLRRRARRW